MLWQDSLLTGVKQIDDQHRELVNRVENVLNAGMQGKGSQEVGRVLQFLSDYVVKHFGDEEVLQRQSWYPEYAQHKQLHDAFVSRVKELIVEFKQKGSTLEMMMKTNKVVVDWLINHINVMDKAFAKYYKQKMSAVG